MNDIKTRVYAKPGAPKLHISDGLSLPLDFITSTDGIFASKGQGKSHLAQVMAEEMLKVHQQIVVIDPTDAWRGLRSSKDGKSEGFPIAVFGGDHGDMKLDPAGAAQLANAIVDEGFSCIVCTKNLAETEEIRYVRVLLDAIYRRNRKPLHIFIDEADIFAPQAAKEQEDFRCVRVMSNIVRRGRNAGIGSTLITQRPSELNASVRSQVEMLFVLGMLNNLDIDAVERWMRLRKKKKGKGAAAFELQEEMIESLDTLQQGDAWVWAPRQGLHLRFRARDKETFDSGRTPKVGGKTLVAKRLAPVDIERLGAAITAQVEKQKAEDPRTLRADLAKVKLELTKANDTIARNAATPAPVAKPGKPRAAIKDGQLAKVEKLITRAEKHYERVQEIADQTLTKLKTAINTTTVDSAVLHAELVNVRDAIKATLAEATAIKTPVRPTTPNRVVTGPQIPLRIPLAPRVNGTAATPAPSDLQPAHLRLLSAIAWWESIGVDEPDIEGVAFIAKTSTKSSAFINNRSRLRAAGYIDYPSPGSVKFTDAGRAIAPPPSIPPTNAAIQEAILGKVQPAVGRLLHVLIENYPNDVSLEDFAKAAGTSATSSAFINNRSWLRARGIAEYPREGYVRASTLLFPEAS